MLACSKTLVSLLFATSIIIPLLVLAKAEGVMSLQYLSNGVFGFPKHDRNASLYADV
jgi:hypothetical protein